MTQRQLELGLAERLTPIKTRSVIYHVAPLKKNDLWRENVKQLLHRINVFNGDRIAAVATGSSTDLHSASEVRKLLEPHDFRVIECRNDKRLREVASFKPLLEMVACNNKTRAVFYAHTKGNSTGCDVQGATYWRNAMYYQLLTRWERCMRELERYAAVGTHKIIWPVGARPPYPTRLMHGHWMFAGTFFWFRCDAVFRTGSEWAKVPNDRYGAEAWLSGMFEPHETKSVYQLWPDRQYPTPNPYDPRIYDEPITDGCFEPAWNWCI